MLVPNLIEITGEVIYVMAYEYFMLIIDAIEFVCQSEYKLYGVEIEMLKSHNFQFYIVNLFFLYYKFLYKVFGGFIKFKVLFVTHAYCVYL